MQIKLLLEIQNTSYTNSLLRDENKKSGCWWGGYWSILWVQHIAVLLRWISFCACVKAANVWLITNQHSAVWDAGGRARPTASDTSATAKANGKSLEITTYIDRYEIYRIDITAALRVLQVFFFFLFLDVMPCVHLCECVRMRVQ